MIVEFTNKTDEVSYWESRQVTLKCLELMVHNSFSNGFVNMGKVRGNEFKKAVVLSDNGTVLKTYVRGDKPDAILYTLNGVTVKGEVVDNPWYEVKEEPVFGDMLTEG